MATDDSRFGRLPALYSTPSGEKLFEALAARRRSLLVGYLAVFTAYMAFIVTFSEYAVAELFHSAIDLAVGADDPWEAFNDFGSVSTASLIAEDYPRPALVALILVFVLLQGLFLWGGGRIRLGPEPVGGRRLVVTLGVSGIFAAVGALGLLMLSLEFVAPENGFEVIENEGMFAAALILTPLGTWLLWLVFGLLLLRRRPQLDALSRILGLLFAGSWIEFVLALSIDPVARDRTCPCATGSWWVLVFAIPLMIWCIGPAIYLLYLREKRIAERQPDRVWRVLMAKTRRKKAEEVSP